MLVSGRVFSPWIQWWKTVGLPQVRPPWCPRKQNGPLFSNPTLLFPYGGFLTWWVSPTTMAFPTKNDHFGVFWGYRHLRKHPYSWLAANNSQLMIFQSETAKSSWAFEDDSACLNHLFQWVHLAMCMMIYSPKWSWKNKSAMYKNMVVYGIQGIILPSHVGIVLNHYKDPNLTSSIM